MPRLLRGNLEAIKTSIDTTNSPLSFKDAPKASRRMEVRYIWIDASCIIQDDADDWPEEAAHMGDVYRNGFCNLGAHAAADKAVGLYLARDPRRASLAVLHVVRHDFDPRYDVTYSYCHVIRFLLSFLTTIRYSVDTAHILISNPGSATMHVASN